MLFIHYLVQLTGIAQNITHENFVAIQKVRSDILNSYTDGKLSNAEKRTLYTASSIIMDYMRKALK